MNAHTKLDELMNLLQPYLVVLTPPERLALFKMGEECFDFIKQSHELAVDYPELFPEFKKAAIFSEAFFIVHELWILIKKINHLRDIINDTEMLAGSYAFEVAMAFYNTIKIAARHDIPGAKVIYEDLKPKFPVKKRKKAKAVKDKRQPELFDD